ncbi:MAG: FecR domain-containing protein [Carboxylicivirga sp.]|jgi:ferric-dicitrate binding protein FerR (iron transport regulator)|nr:FecR domain-containing protein [Carboxylicivirga sp.]
MKFEEVLSRYILEDYSRDDKKAVAAWKEEKDVSESSIDLLRFAFRNSGKKKSDSTEVLKKRLSYRINEQRSNRYQRLRFGLIVRVAATIILPLLLVMSVYYFNNQLVRADSFISMNVPIGTTSNVLLPDGSEVILNSGSSIKYSANLHKKKQRLVELKGEGFFSVTSDKAHPFIVKTSEINVKVIGTKFNVKSYCDETDVIVSLLEGSVRLLDNKSNQFFDVLKPGEVATLSKSDRKLNVSLDSEVNKRFSWIDGKQTFVKEPFEKVLKTMERKYNVKFILKNKELKNMTITASLENETLEEFLFIITNSTETNYEIKPKKKDGSKKQVIIRKADN